MKIVHICQYYADNMGYQENILPFYQSKYDNEVVIITSDREPMFHNNINSRIKGVHNYYVNGVEIMRLPIYFETVNKFVLFNGLLDKLNVLSPDYIFHHGLTSPSLLTCIKYKKKHPNAILRCDNHADYYNSARSNLSMFYHSIVWANILDKRIKYIDKIYGVSPERVDFVKKVYKIPETKLGLLPLGGEPISNEVYNIKRDTYRKLLGVSDNDFLIIHAGKFAPAKRTDILLSAFNKISDSKLYLILIGSFEPEYESEIKSIIKLNNNVIFLGWQKPEELINYFCAGDLLVQPGSLSAIFEQAICCGLPVILNRCPTTEFLTSYDNGILINGENEKEVELAISTMVSNKEQYNIMKRKAFDFGHEILSYDVVAKKSLLIV